jgi:hypothetical protein
VSIPPPEQPPALSQQPPPYQVTYPPPQYYAGPAAPSRTLGVVAFVAGLVVMVGSPILSIVTGSLLGHILPAGAGFAAGFAAGSNSSNPEGAITGLLILVQLLFGSGLGIWALVQGIVAVRLRRGRSWGIVAIVLAAVAPILSFIVYIVAIAIAQSAG